VPFPDGATDIVYDENRPYLRCVVPLTIDAALEAFGKGLAGEGLVAARRTRDRGALAQRQTQRRGRKRPTRLFQS